MYPAMFFLPRPERSSRLLLLFRPLLAVPHLLWSLLFALVAGAVQFLSFWCIVFAGRHPRALWGVLDRYFRYSSLLQAWMMFLADAYPPFTGSADRVYPVALRVTYPERMSRATVFFRLLLLFPHYFFAIGFSFVYGIVQFLTWWTILFAGRSADWQYASAASYFIYTARLGAYTLFLVDEYPPFNGVQPRAAELNFSNAEIQG